MSAGPGLLAAAQWHEEQARAARHTVANQRTWPHDELQSQKIENRKKFTAIAEHHEISAQRLRAIAAAAP